MGVGGYSGTRLVRSVCTRADRRVRDAASSRTPSSPLRSQSWRVRTTAGGHESGVQAASVVDTEDPMHLSIKAYAWPGCQLWTRPI